MIDENLFEWSPKTGDKITFGIRFEIGSMKLVWQMKDIALPLI